MPPAEGKESEGKDGEEAVPLDPLIVAFTSFCTERAFSDEVQTFFEDHCEPFENASLSDEQQLDWTEIHDRYVRLVEQRLESFCKEHDVDERVVFQKMRDSASSVDREFVPAVIQNAEYSYFFDNMKLTAEARQSRRDAARAGDEATSTTNTSGVWTYDATRFDEDACAQMLKLSKCPWAFRPMFLRAARNMDDACVTHTSDTLTFKYKFPFFGHRSKVFVLDGKPRRHQNFFRSWRESSAKQTDRGIAAESVDPEGKAPPTRQTFELGTDRNGREQLEWTQHIKGLEIRHFFYRA